MNRRELIAASLSVPALALGHECSFTHYSPNMDARYCDCGAMVTGPQLMEMEHRVKQMRELKSGVMYKVEYQGRVNE